MADAEVLATLALTLVPGIGHQRMRLLLGAFGTAQAALEAPHAQLAALHGIGRAAATAIRAAARPNARRNGARTGERTRPRCRAVGGIHVALHFTRRRRIDSP